MSQKFLRRTLLRFISMDFHIIRFYLKRYATNYLEFFGCYYVTYFFAIVKLTIFQCLHCTHNFNPLSALCQILIHLVFLYESSSPFSVRQSTWINSRNIQALDWFLRIARANVQCKHEMWQIATAGLKTSELIERWECLCGKKTKAVEVCFWI